MPSSTFLHLQFIHGLGSKSSFINVPIKKVWGKKFIYTSMGLKTMLSIESVMYGDWGPDQPHGRSSNCSVAGVLYMCYRQVKATVPYE